MDVLRLQIRRVLRVIAPSPAPLLLWTLMERAPSLGTVPGTVEKPDYALSIYTVSRRLKAPRLEVGTC